VATHLPKLGVVDVGGNNLFIASDIIFWAHELDESVIDDCTIREEQRTSRGEGWEVKKLLLNSDKSVIFFG
jgi:hypothetical protein